MTVVLELDVSTQTRVIISSEMLSGWWVTKLLQEGEWPV